MSIARRTATSSDARCTLCPGVMVLWADRDKHTVHLLPEPQPTPQPTPTRIPFAVWAKPLGAATSTVTAGYYATKLARQARYSPTTTPASPYGAGYQLVLADDGAPLYVIPRAAHPRQPVVWMSSNGTGPAAPDDWAGGLQVKLRAVPIPVGPNGEPFDTYYGRPLVPTAQGDQQISIYDPFTDELWEFWLLKWTGARWECGYAGYVAAASLAPRAIVIGGARATGLPLCATNIGRAELEAGVIRHPLGIAVPVTTGTHVAPANRDDGWAATIGGDNRDAVPEGAWFRLPASTVAPAAKYGTATPAAASKSRLYAMLIAAARDYGLIVDDQTGGGTTISIEAANAVGTPYGPPASSLVAGQGITWGPGSVLNDFPWESLVQIAPPA